MLKLYNSLPRKIEDFKPIHPSKVGMYTCGPTVYDFVTVGNWRTYTLGDLLFRTLTYFGFQVDYIMNITDVGHLTGDNLGDASTGEDRMIKATKREHKSAWEIAKFYTDDFLWGFKELNLNQPRLFTKATDHIKEQIDLIKKIEVKGFTYVISDGIYFNVRAYEEAGFKYGELSTLDVIKEGARVAKNPEKKDPRDFALWKFSPSTSLRTGPSVSLRTSPRLRSEQAPRQMEWESPWVPPGSQTKVMGFPGWHIECSAMSMKYLGEQFDIHIGGEDLRSTHHPNEIAQSEAASGKAPFVKYWVHGAFLLVDGDRMGKSVGNAHNLHDVIQKGFSPLDLRYFYLTGHYRKPLNFTWENLDAAMKGRQRLSNFISEWKLKAQEGIQLSSKAQELNRQFDESLKDNLNFPQALSVAWRMTKEKIDDSEKYLLLNKWDRILGLRLGKAKKVEIPQKVLKLVLAREEARKANDWEKSDKIRKEIEEQGFIIEDTDSGPKIKPANGQ